MSQERKSPIFNRVVVECSGCNHVLPALFRTFLCCGETHGIMWGSGQVLEWRDDGASLRGWLLPFAEQHPSPLAFCGDCRPKP